MRNKNTWITLSLVNLCIVALLGLTLRTKFLFSMPFIDYKNFLSAHSHFAFGGWVTLALMTLFIDQLLTQEQKQEKTYQWILAGILFSSFGMLVTFPFQGYALFSIIFSTLFIFFTYAFSWIFIRDTRKMTMEAPVRLLAISAMLCLVISSIGPFSLAYQLATKSGNAILYRNSIYTYLHFQYNGFFVLAVFALFINRFIKDADNVIKERVKLFSAFLCLSIIPALFLSLLWKGYNPYLNGLRTAGWILTIITLAIFCSFSFRKRIYDLGVSTLPIARTLLYFSMASFAIKMLLQTGTAITELRNAVFGYRPVIIGFLHLVFLGLVTFYILSTFLSTGVFPKTRFSKLSIIYFSAAVILNELILLADGIGHMYYITHPIYPWLLWGASMLLFTGALFVLIARLRPGAVLK